MKNSRLFILFFVLASAVAFIFLKDSTLFSADWHDEFGYEDVDKVKAIHLKDKQGNEMWLRRERGQWKVNGTYPARIHLVEQVLEAVEKMEAVQPISANAHDFSLHSLMQKSVFVEVFAGGMKPVRQYHVGGSNLSGKATIMLRQKGNKAAPNMYEVRIPGSQGYFSSRFVIDEDAWRTRDVMTYNPEKIEAIEIAYSAHDSLQSFRLDVKENKLYRADGSLWSDDLLPLAVNKLKYGFERLTLESYENDNALIDSIKIYQPFARIQVTTPKGKDEVQLYYKAVNERSKVLFFGRKNPKWDPDRYWAHVNEGKDFVMVQDYVWGKVLVDPEKLIR